MDADEIRLDIQGPAEAIDPRALSEGIGRLVNLLEHLELPQHEEAPAWSVSGLRIGSLQADLRGSEQAVSIALGGLAQLADEPGVPDGWTFDAIRELLKLGQVRRQRGVEQVKLSLDSAITTIDEVVLSNARESLKPWPMSLGSVQGKLFRYNDRDREAGIEDEVTGHRIPVIVPEENVEEVTQLLRRDVCVWGEIHHTPTGRIDRVVLEGIEPLPERGQHAPVSELAGILGEDWTGGVSAVEAVRRQRD